MFVKRVKSKTSPTIPQLTPKETYKIDVQNVRGEIGWTWGISYVSEAGKALKIWTKRFVQFVANEEHNALFSEALPTEELSRRMQLYFWYEVTDVRKSFKEHEAPLLEVQCNPSFHSSV